MGRHSAPDDPDDAEQPTAAVAVREREETGGGAGVDRVLAAPGRHSRSDEPVVADDVPELIPPVLDEPVLDEPVLDEPVLDEPVLDEPHRPAPRPAPVTAPVETGPPPGHTVFRGAAHNSAADLHLVRSNRGVLALCAAAVVLPFVVEIVVLVVLGTVDGHSVLVWLWAPLVVAGVLLGVALDIAHRRHASVPDDGVSAS